MKNKWIIAIIALLCASVEGFAQADTLCVSDKVNIQLVFPTDVTYMDISNSSLVGVRQPGEKGVVNVHNVIIVKAFREFHEPVSLAVMEANGRMHTWIVKYVERPRSLYVDLRGGGANSGLESIVPIKGGRTARSDGASYVEGGGVVASTWKEGNAPSLADIAAMKRGLYHLVAKDYNITITCDNIFSHSNVLYLSFTISNNSSTSYDLMDTGFEVYSTKKSKRTANVENKQNFMSRWGATSVPPNTQARVVYTFEKLTLSRSQALNVYFSETSPADRKITGRNLVMSIPYKDINNARNPETL